MPRKHPQRALVLTLVLSVVAFVGGRASGQCILANPSFELSGSGGDIFGGWNQYGTVGVVPDAYHGRWAARVSSPDSGDWDLSAYWQVQDCEPGEQWEVTGHVRHPATRPLSGGSVAFVAVEWHDGSGEVIDVDTFTVADHATPIDAFVDFELLSGPAPAGTATAVLIFGVLHGPSDPVPDVHYDQVTFYSTSPPTIDDLQWNDFPGGRTLAFGGHVWRVKGPGYYGPGPNVFCDADDCVWIDAQDQLHITLQNRGGIWTSTEVTTEESLGYGDYILTTVGRLDLLDPAAVLGIFLWEYGPCWDYAYTWWNAFNEIDIEYSRWGNPFNEIGQFVAQPFDYPGNTERFDYEFSEDEVTSHAMRWLHDRVEYRVWRGGPDDETPANLIHTWTYAGPHIPRPEQPRMHLNLWKQGEVPPDSNQEIVFTNFVFVPEGPVGIADEGPGGSLPGAVPGRLLPAVPNPFNPRTTMRFELARGGTVELAVYDLTGRRVRTLARGRFAAGEHRAVWDGRNDGGRMLASGVYLLQLRGAGFVESRPVTLLK